MSEQDVRTYRGHALEDVLPRIREELGDDAEVVARRESLEGGVGGFFAKKVVEVDARPARREGGLDVIAGDDEPSFADTLAALAQHGAAEPGSGPVPGLDDVLARPSGQGDLASLFAAGLEPPADQTTAAEAADQTTAAEAADHPSRAGLEGPVEEQGTAGLEGPASAAGGPQHPAEDLPSAPEEPPAVEAPPVPEADPVPPLEVEHVDPAADPVPDTTPDVPAEEVVEVEHVEPGAPDPESTAPDGADLLREAFDEGPVPQETIDVDADALEAAALALSGPEPSEDETAAAAAAAAEWVRVQAEAAAAQTAEPAEVAPPEPEAAQVIEPPAEVVASAEAAPPAAVAPPAEVPSPAAATPAASPLDAAPAPDAGDHVAHLVARGFSPSFAEALVADAQVHLAPFTAGADEGELARRALANRIPVFAPRRRGHEGVAAFVGAGGSGKTHVILRLAQAYAERSALPVAVVALRPKDGGAELERALGGRVEVAVGADTEATAAHVERLRATHLVLLDTPAVAPRDVEALRDLAADLTRLQADEVHFAVPAPTGPGASRELATAARTLGAHAIVVTHADATAQLGTVVELAMETSLPLSYVSHGPVQPAAAHELAAALVG